MCMATGIRLVSCTKNMTVNIQTTVFNKLFLHAERNSKWKKIKLLDLRN